MYTRQNLPEVNQYTIDNIIGVAKIIYNTSIETCEDLLHFMGQYSSPADNNLDKMPLDIKYIKAANKILVDNEKVDFYFISDKAFQYIEKCKKENIVPDNFNNTKLFIENVIFNDDTYYEKKDFNEKANPYWTKCPSLTKDFVLFFCFVIEAKPNDFVDRDYEEENYEVFKESAKLFY